MAQARLSHESTLLLDGRVLVTGGDTGAGSGATSIASAELFDPSQGIFWSAGSMRSARLLHRGSLLSSGTVLIFGGADNRGSELYTPGTSPSGGTCDVDLDCGDAGVCSVGDRVCCNTRCDGLCESCALAGKGGTCSPIAFGQDPNDECTGSGSCGASCNGERQSCTGYCRWPRHL